MLKSVPVIINVIVIIVGICKKIILHGKNIRGTHIYFGQVEFFGFPDCENILSIVSKILTLFISEIGIGLTITNDLERSFYPDGPVIGSYDEPGPFLGDPLNGLQQGRMYEPGIGN